jgi:hypothetical protein
MNRAEQYRINAEEAERAARQARSDDERRAYEKIAAGWRDLERQNEEAVRRGR